RLRILVPPIAPSTPHIRCVWLVELEEIQSICLRIRPGGVLDIIFFVSQGAVLGMHHSCAKREADDEAPVLLALVAVRLEAKLDALECILDNVNQKTGRV